MSMSTVGLYVLLVTSGCVLGHDHSEEAQIVYQWNTVEYEWPNATSRQQAIDAGTYKPENSAINGIKLYKDKVYVTVPRFSDGVPSTLNVIVKNTSPDVNASHLLRPFPSWEMQTFLNCSALQRVQSMEIDPTTGYMWIIDTGYRPSGRNNVSVQPLDSCPAKLIIYDLNNDTEVHRYVFPKSIVGAGMFYLNDIVLGFHNNSARYAFLSDTLDYKLVVYDYAINDAYTYSHSNMMADKQYENITISNKTVQVITGINGIGMSPDFKYVYYSSVAGVGLHQIETSVLTSAQGSTAEFAANVRTVGQKVAPGDGMAYGAKNNLYFSVLGSNAIYKWDIQKDLAAVDGNFNAVQLTSQSELVSDPLMDWVDTLAIDEKGYLWFTTSRLNKFFSQEGIVHHEPNFFVWKIFVDDYNYMDHRWQKGPTLDGSCFRGSPALLLLAVVLAVIF